MIKLICFLFGHIWKKTTTRRYDSVGGTNYYKCQRCGKKTKRWTTEYL